MHEEEMSAGASAAWDPTWDETGFVSVRGVRLYVRICGSGPPLLLLHGFTGSGETWAPVCAQLARSQTCIAVDLLGHGCSDAPPSAERYGMQDTVTDLLAVMEALGYAQFSCLGYSMGGRIALGLAVAAPSRLCRLVLESASPGLADEGARRERQAQDERLAEQILRDGVEAFVDRWEQLPLFATQRRAAAAALAQQRAIRLQQRALGLANSLRGIGTGAQPSFWEDLPGVRQPVLLVTGEDDRKFTRIAHEMAACVPAARHVVIPEAGHAVHLEQPEAFCRVVAGFLQDTSGQKTSRSGAGER